MTLAVSVEELAARVDVCLRVRRVPRVHRGYVASALLGASLRGIDTHGVALLPTYLRELDGGRADPRPRIRFERTASAVGRLDAAHALGPVAAATALDWASELAHEAGAGIVSVRNSNHFGAAGAYTLPAARKGLIVLCCSNSDALVSGHGGSVAAFGTNPLSVAAPGIASELCVDMATSQVSFTRASQELARGGAVPASWGVVGGASARGLVLRPLGGHKGHCLALTVEVLTALLAGGPFDHEIPHFYSEPFDRPRGVSHFLLALRISALTPEQGFRARLERLLGWLRSDGECALHPGETEQRTARERLRHGIPVPEELHRLLVPRDGAQGLGGR